MKSLLLASLSALTLAACAAGPDYVAPIAPPKAAASFATANAATITTAPDNDWWRMYRDPVLDGLVAGVCLISNGIFFAYSYMLVRDIGSSTYFNLASFIAAVLIGACAGFLPLNWNPAKLFMGDSGALVLGLLMATSAIAIRVSLLPIV